MTTAPIILEGAEARVEVDRVELELISSDAGPKRTSTLESRGSDLTSSEEQLRILDALNLLSGDSEADFGQQIARSGWEAGFTPGQLEIFQINLGKLCNMTCRHCHVDAGPDRVTENMDRETVDACLRALDASGATTVDLTGGAPELNPNFEYLVDQCVARGKHVMDRCNLTVLLLPRFAHLPQWFADHGVEIVCSLPHYRKMSTDRQRGDGTYAKSIEALKRLNAVGYGQGDPARVLTLVTNPAGAFLPGGQQSLESEWKAALMRNHGVRFDRLFTITNMPISRYLEWLIESENLETYMTKLVNSFNPATVNGLMCRNTISVSWDGRLFDCDFNQMLDLEVQASGGMSIFDFDGKRLAERQIATRRHCFGCTAGAGSSCGGATA